MKPASRLDPKTAYTRPVSSSMNGVPCDRGIASMSEIDPSRMSLAIKRPAA